MKTDFGQDTLFGKKIISTMSQKVFIATYFDNLKDAFECATKYKLNRKDNFEVITNGEGYFVVSQKVLKKVFGVETRIEEKT